MECPILVIFFLLWRRKYGDTMIIEFLLGMSLGMLMMTFWMVWDFYRWGEIAITLDISIEKLVDDMYSGHHRYGRDNE